MSGEDGGAEIADTDEDWEGVVVRNCPDMGEKKKLWKTRKERWRK